MKAFRVSRLITGVWYASVLTRFMLLDVLQNIFADTPVPHAEDLLNIFEKMKNSLPSNRSDPPSTTVRFIERIENANPNVSGINEDNTNANWGHWQFTAGNLTLRSVLKTWSDIGDVTTGYRLLAASLKTCLVARHLCFTNKISVQSSYLSDCYFRELVDILWNILGSVGTEVVSHTLLGDDILLVLTYG